MKAPNLATSTWLVTRFLTSTFLALGCSSALAQLTDGGIHAPPTTGTYGYNTFRPGTAGFPALGGFYADPVFGLPVRRLTNVVGATNCDDIYAHHWANADATYAFNNVMVSGFCQGPRIISTTTGAVVYSNQPAGLAFGDLYWDANDPDRYYYFAGSSLMRRNLAAQTSTTMKTFPAALQSVGQSLNIQDRTGRYLTVRYGGTNKVWDSQTDTIYSGSVTPLDPGGWTSITPDGKYLVDSSAQYYSYPIDHVNKTVGPGTMFWSLCGDHGALVSASNGKSYLVTFNCNNDPAIFRVDLTLNQAGRTAVQQAADNTKLIPLTWNDAGHFSAVSKGSLSDWVFMSTESVIDSFDSSTANWTAYRQEILAVNVVTLQIKRLAHHRSRSITANYQTMPRVSTSWDGSLVMWASNFDSSSPTGYADLYAIPSPLGASSYYTVTPCRLYDSRVPGLPLLPGEVRVVSTYGTACGVGYGGRALALNVTATGATAAGNLRVYPAYSPVPNVSVVNYAAGQTRAGNVVIGLSPQGDLAIRASQASGTVHVILDVVGYFQ